jgi:hypothetical protein
MQQIFVFAVLTFLEYVELLEIVNATSTKVTSSIVNGFVENESVIALVEHFDHVPHGYLHFALLHSGIQLQHATDVSSHDHLCCGKHGSYVIHLGA